VTAQPAPSNPGVPTQTPASAPSLARRLRAFPATFGLIGFTAGIFVLQFLSTIVFGQDWLINLGAKIGPLMAAGQWWRFLTPVFLHASLLHISVNMYSLYAIGPAVERFFDTPRMLAIYLLSGIGGVVLSLAFSSGASVGASGAIFGLLGALAAFFYLHRSIFGRFGMIQLRQLIFIALLNLMLGLSPGIDNWGHVGGLVTGACLTLALGPRYAPDWNAISQPRLTDRRPWSEVRPGFLVALALLAAISLVLVLRMQ
jgi:rhomboid protease GluP